MKYVLIQTAIGDYRQSVMKKISDKLSGDFLAFAGREYFYRSTVTNIDIGDRLRLVNNIFLAKRRFLFQYGVFFHSVFADSVILEFNPRILSNWLIVFLRKCLLKKTIFWGHAWGRSGQAGGFSKVRRIFRSLCDVLVVYTERQKQEILNEGRYSGRIVVAPNSLYAKDEMQPVSATADRGDFIYVGRLVAEKKVELLVSAFLLFCRDVSDSKLILVGDGPESARLRSLVEASEYRNRVCFMGHISDAGTLHNLYQTAAFSVSPGYVGLSITQSLGFGVPMIISKNEPHAPEIEAAVEGVNCIYFNKSAIDDLRNCLLASFESRGVWNLRAASISAECAIAYSSDVMSERLMDAFRYGEN